VTVELMERNDFALALDLVQPKLSTCAVIEI
jgi:hypothetical protein